MRILMADKPVYAHCIAKFNGEAEDYSVDLIARTVIILDPNYDPNNSDNKITVINENQNENSLNVITVLPTPSAEFIHLSKQSYSRYCSIPNNKCIGRDGIG